MKTLIILVLTLLAVSAQAKFRSPFPSSVDGMSTPNAHYVDSNHQVIRSMAPNSTDELISMGIDEVLIFKKQSRKEVDYEIIDLAKAGYSKSSIHHIPFLWKGIRSYKKSCSQVVSALQIINEAVRNNKKILFHCTVGEDRTGVLAGLWKMLDQKWSLKQAFYYEMCENGYGAGNPDKPSKVYNAIRKELTPLYVYMANLIEEGILSLDNLNPDICMEPRITSSDLKCRRSSKYPSE